MISKRKKQFKKKHTKAKKYAKQKSRQKPMRNTPVRKNIELNWDSIISHIKLDKLDRLTGLELEIPSISEDFPNQLSLDNIYNVSKDRPGDGRIYNVSKEEEPEVRLSEPFDPSKIRVNYKEFPIDMILRRIQAGELNLNPGFQRSSDVWNEDAQSRLIESLLIRIPIPVFYIDGSEDDCWLVVDGLQRLSTFKKFALEKNLRLKNLEFLTELHGKNFDDLPKSLQRRISESTIGIYLIEKGTPQKVKISIFDRINTGGLPLSKQEIRHALFQGQATSLLDRLSKNEKFKSATDNGIGQERMADRECILRCLSFLMTSPDNYAERNIDGFLNEAMAKIQSLSPHEIETLEQKFLKSMQANIDIFEKQAFRKIYPEQKDRYPVNRSLFEVWTVCLANLKDRDLNRLKQKKHALKSKFSRLLRADKEFDGAISSGTGEVKKVKMRFERVSNLIKEILDDKKS